MRDCHVDTGVFDLDRSGQRDGLFLFTMDDEDLARQWTNGSYVSQEIVTIRMG
jgi:hypothetical protein